MNVNEECHITYAHRAWAKLVVSKSNKPRDFRFAQLHRISSSFCIRPCHSILRVHYASLYQHKTTYIIELTRCNTTSMENKGYKTSVPQFPQLWKTNPDIQINYIKQISPGVWLEWVWHVTIIFSRINITIFVTYNYPPIYWIYSIKASHLLSGLCNKAHHICLLYRNGNITAYSYTEIGTRSGVQHQLLTQALTNQWHPNNGGIVLFLSYRKMRLPV